MLFAGLLSGKRSKPKVKRSIETTLDNLFEASCKVSANSYQTIKLKGASFDVRGDCKVTLRNEAVVNAQCDMETVIEKLVDAIMNSDKTYSRILADSDEILSGTGDEVDELEIKNSLTQRLTATCKSSVQAQQYVELEGGNHTCTEDGTINLENLSDVRAMCLKGVLFDGVDRAIGDGGGAPGSGGEGGGDGGGGLPLWAILLIVLASLSVAVLLVALVVVMRSKAKSIKINPNNKNKNKKNK